MGFLDSILGSNEEGQKSSGTDNPSSPLEVSLSFSPLRLSANRTSSIDLLVRIRNISGEKQLISIDVALPRKALLGFDSTCLNKSIEKQGGELKPGASVELPFRVWSNTQTKEGSYPIDVSIYCHYLDYAKVISSLKRSTSVRVV